MKIRNKFYFFLFVALFLLGFVPADKDIYLEIAKNLEIFGKVYKEISINYVDKINPESFMRTGIKAMLGELDPYTVFLDESMQKDFDLINNGKYSGIGASVGIRNGKITIIDIIYDSPAQREGLRIGDVILEINSKEINKDNFDKMTNEITGNPGKNVKLLIEREGLDDPQIFNLRLEQIEIKNISYFGFFPEGSNNAYIKLSGFSRGAGEEIKQAIIDLRKIRKINSIILDLRNNPGGLLEEAIDVSEKFISKGKLIVSISGRDSSKKLDYFSQEKPLASDVVLAILVNENTASAAEIVAGAVQDHDCGIIIGKNTFGKGLVQTIVPITNKTSLKITTAKYFTPSGRCIQKINYSTDNKPIESYKDNRQLKYFTENNRNVYANGGITPDTILENNDESELIIDLKSKNLIGQFANYYINTEDSIDFRNLNEKILFEGFTKFLDIKNYKFNSGANVEAKKLLSKFKSNKVDLALINQFNNIVSALDKNEALQIQKEQDEILSLIRIELYNRIANRTDRYKLLLREDTLLKSAINMLSNHNKYEEFLKNN